jgi:hypothetical protein
LGTSFHANFAHFQVRFIKEVPVFAVTASFSIIAYFWLLIIAAWLWESEGWAWH